MAGSEDHFGQKDDDLDLYDDFIVSKVDPKYAAKQKQHNEDLERENENLKLRIIALEQEFETTKKTNIALRRNISVLFKTAKQEIEGKNCLIKDLQTRYDSLVFRRSNRVAVPFWGNSDLNSPKYTESQSRAPDTTIEENAESNRFVSYSSNSRLSLSLRSKQAETYSRHHQRSRSTHRETPSAFGVQSPGPAVHISDKKCENDVPCIINKNPSEKYGGSNNSVENDKPKDKLGATLNGDVLNSISIDSLMEITKLCEASSPKNLKTPLNFPNKDITDTERVLAHYKRTAKVSVAQNDTKHVVKRALSTFVGQKCDDNNSKFQAERNRRSASSLDRRQHSKHITNQRDIPNQRRQNGKVYSKPIRNCNFSKASSDNSKIDHAGNGDFRKDQKKIVSTSLLKMKNTASPDRSSTNKMSVINSNVIKDADSRGDMSSLDKSSVKEIDLPNLQKNAENSCVLRMNHNLENKMEVSDKTSATLCDIGESHSLEEEMLRGCHIDGIEGQQNNEATKLTDIKPDYLEMDKFSIDVQSATVTVSLGLSCETRVCESRNEKTPVGKVNDCSCVKPNGDLKERHDKRNDGCNKYLESKTTEKTNNERHSMESSAFPTSNSVTIDRPLVEGKKKFSTKQAKSKRDMESHHKKLHRRARTDEPTKPQIILCAGSRRRLSKRSEESDRTSILPHRKSYNEKHRHNESEKIKSRFSHRESREGHKRSRSLLVRDHSTKNSGKHENKFPLTSDASNSGKQQRQSHDSYNSQLSRPAHDPIFKSRKSRTTTTHISSMSNGAHKDKRRAQASCLQEFSKKRELVELDLLPKNENSIKKARLKKDCYSFTKNRTLPCDKDSTSASFVLVHKTAESLSSDNNLEEGELLSEEDL